MAVRTDAITDYTYVARLKRLTCPPPSGRLVLHDRGGVADARRLLPVEQHLQPIADGAIAAFAAVGLDARACSDLTRTAWASRTAAFPTAAASRVQGP